METCTRSEEAKIAKWVPPETSTVETRTFRGNQNKAKSLFTTTNVEKNACSNTAKNNNEKNLVHEKPSGFAEKQDCDSKRER